MFYINFQIRVGIFSKESPFQFVQQMLFGVRDWCHHDLFNKKFSFRDLKSTLVHKSRIIHIKTFFMLEYIWNDHTEIILEIFQKCSKNCGKKLQHYFISLFPDMDSDELNWPFKYFYFSLKSKIPIFCFLRKLTLVLLSSKLGGVVE